MAITLDGIALDQELIWSDEFDWMSPQQGVTRTLGGRVILQQRTLYHGQPITLQGDNTTGFIVRSDLLLLNTLANQRKIMTLTLNDGSTYQVVFRYSEKSIEATPFEDFSDPGPDDLYRIVIRLMTV